MESPAAPAGRSRAAAAGPGPSSALHSPPAHRRVLDGGENQPVNDKVEKPDENHSRDDLAKRVELQGTEDHEAQATGSHEHLAGDEGTPAIPHAEPDADHDAG